MTGAIIDYRRVPLPSEPPLYRETSPEIFEAAPFLDEYEIPLVLGLKSQDVFERAFKKRAHAFLVYPSTVKIVRDAEIRTKISRGDRKKIDAFSDRSRRKLRRTAVDAWPALTSQFVLTYPAEFPTDGRDSKKHLNTFLTAFRHKFKGHPYLWVLEFQRRGAPHYHLFLDLAVTEATRKWLAETWVRIACANDSKALAFHSNAKNYIEWDMGNGAYVAKYLEKENQKHVPDGYTDVGRFWGSSRGLIPEPMLVEAEDMMIGYQGKGIQKPVTRAVRVLARLHKQITCKWGFENQKVVPTWTITYDSEGRKIPKRSRVVIGPKTGGPKRLSKSRVNSAHSIYSFQVVNGKRIFSEILKWYERGEVGRKSFAQWSRSLTSQGGLL